MKCRRCGANIGWKQDCVGKWEPLNLDGTSHFSTCPQAKAWKNQNKNSGTDYTKLGIKDKQQTKIKGYSPYSPHLPSVC